MGFAPITGGGTTTAHTHSNAANDGGSLNTDTLFLNGPMIAWLDI